MYSNKIGKSDYIGKYTEYEAYAYQGQNDDEVFLFASVETEKYKDTDSRSGKKT